MTAPWYADGLLTPDEVRRIFHVDRATVYRWGRAGKLDSIRTLGGHRRYRRSQVEALLRSEQRGTR